jgi:hypothetical protein
MTFAGINKKIAYSVHIMMNNIYDNMRKQQSANESVNKSAGDLRM